MGDGSQSNVWLPGGSTGWHTHPGHSFVTVTAGAITNYDADDPTCTGTVYTKGMTYVDHGGEHAHLIRARQIVARASVAMDRVSPIEQRISLRCRKIGAR